MKAFIQHNDSKGNKMILQSLIPFEKLKDIVIFTYRSDGIQKEEDAKVKSSESKEYYQRRVDSKRSDEIKKFIKESILQEYRNVQMATLFPTSMILAISTDDFDNKYNTINKEDGNICNIDIKTNVFIVDGQHRMMGMIKLFDELSQLLIRTEEEDYIYDYLLNYNFNCSILVNYDLWEQGQVFVNVNFKQKPVNKSLYYDIFGSDYREGEENQKRNKIYVAHMMTRALNERKESPFYQHIKMLGTGAGYISQAFVVESVLRNMRTTGLWYFDPDYFNVQDTERYETELISFFAAIKEMFSSYWPSEDSTTGTIICKTTGFGAWMSLIGMVRNDDDLEMISCLKRSASDGSLCREYIDRVQMLLAPLKGRADELFGERSEFTYSSGKAAETKLFKKMLYIIENASKEKKTEVIFGHDVNYYGEKIQEYLWTNPIDDLDSLAHHYETDDISDFKVTRSDLSGNLLKIHATFNINVTLYIDNEEDAGFSMEFPADCIAFFEKDGNEYKLTKENMNISVNTDKYYK